jgi:hypothetical protein
MSVASIETGIRNLPHPAVTLGFRVLESCVDIPSTGTAKLELSGLFHCAAMNSIGVMWLKE